MDMIGRIRRLHARKNKSEREISRITGLSRNTVRSGCKARSLSRRSTGATSRRTSSPYSTRRLSRR